MNQNPWTFAEPAEPTSAIPPTDDHEPLPLPPNPTHRRWKNRCYNCLEVGHDQNDCNSDDRVCARCWIAGHMARDCHHTPLARRQRFDPLIPRGNMGEADLPPNRPQATMIFIPETQHIYNTNADLTRAIVIDARLRPDHCYMTMQPLLMAACASDLPFPLTHIADSRYLLLLPSGADREKFLSDYGHNLQALGLIAYPWSAGIDATGLTLKYKAWIELKKLSPQQWNLDHLIPAVSTFGVVLEHSPMQNVRSMERMMAVVALTDLSKIPKHVLFWEKGLLRTVQIVVHSWLEEPISGSPAADTTPPDSVFDEVRVANLQALEGLQSDQGEPDSITVAFDTLFSIWMSLQPGQKKDELEATLRRSPQFFERETARVRSILQRGQIGGAGTDATPPPNNTDKGVVQTQPLESPVLVFTGDDAADLILRSINCEVKTAAHDNSHQASPPVNSGLEQHAKGNQTRLSPLSLGHASNPSNWAEIINIEDTEDSNSVDCDGKAINSAQLNKAQDKGKQPLAPNSPMATPKTQKGKRARKRAKKMAIQTELRRSVRIAENPGTKHYTPKKDAKQGGQPSKVSQIAKTVDQAQILRALSDDTISTQPLYLTDIRRIDNYCGSVAAVDLDAATDEAANGGLQTLQPELDPIHTTAADPNVMEEGTDQAMADQAEPGQEEGEPDEEQFEEPYEEPYEEIEPEEEAPVVAAEADIEPAESHADQEESVLAGINFDSDDDLLDSEIEESASSA